MRVRSILVVILASFLASCKDAPTQPSGSVQNDILESALRDRISSYVGTDTIGHSVVYFVEIGQADSAGEFAQLSDPDANLLGRFAFSNPPVKPYSSCQTPPVVDKQTGTNGRLFAFTLPTEQNGHALVEAADYVGISIDLFRLYLSQGQEGWRVDSLQARGSIN